MCTIAATLSASSVLAGPSFRRLRRTSGARANSRRSARIVTAATPAALESDDWTAFDEAVDAFNDDEDGPDGLLAIEKVMSLVPSLVAALESGAVDDGKTAFKFLNAYDELISALKDMGKDSEAAKDLQKNVVASMSAFLGAHKDKLAESGLLESAEETLEEADTFE